MQCTPWCKSLQTAGHLVPVNPHTMVSRAGSTLLFPSITCADLLHCRVCACCVCTSRVLLRWLFWCSMLQVASASWLVVV
jgi:hypothetical protein